MRARPARGLQRYTRCSIAVVDWAHLAGAQLRRPALDSPRPAAGPVIDCDEPVVLDCSVQRVLNFDALERVRMIRRYSRAHHLAKIHRVRSPRSRATHARARPTHAGSRSTAQATRPSRAATAAVVPRPQKGSPTTSSGKLNRVMQRSGSSSGKGVGCAGSSTPGKRHTREGCDFQSHR